MKNFISYGARVRETSPAAGNEKEHFAGAAAGFRSMSAKEPWLSRIVAVHLSLFGVAAEKAGGGEHVEVALRKSELFRCDLPFVPVHHRGREVELGKPAPAHHAAFEIGAEAVVRERDGPLPLREVLRLRRA